MARRVFGRRRVADMFAVNGSEILGARFSHDLSILFHEFIPSILSTCPHHVGEFRRDVVQIPKIRNVMLEQRPLLRFRMLPPLDSEIRHAYRVV
jgi:hypothetical protein